MPANPVQEAQYYRDLASACRELLNIFGQEDAGAQEKQVDESGVSEYRRKLEAKLELFDSKLLGLIGDPSLEQ